jgi:hypothetical protein
VRAGGGPESCRAEEVRAAASSRQNHLERYMALDTRPLVWMHVNGLVNRGQVMTQVEQGVTPTRPTTRRMSDGGLKYIF